MKTISILIALFLSSCEPQQKPSDINIAFIYKDPMTGCHYLANTRDTAFVPRMQKNGSQLCD